MVFSWPWVCSINRWRQQQARKAHLLIVGDVLKDVLLPDSFSAITEINSVCPAGFLVFFIASSCLPLEFFFSSWFLTMFGVNTIVFFPTIACGISQNLEHGAQKILKRKSLITVRFKSSLISTLLPNSQI